MNYVLQTIVLLMTLVLALFVWCQQVHLNSHVYYPRFGSAPTELMTMLLWITETKEMFLNIHKTSSTLEKHIRCVVDIRASTLHATSPLHITWIIKQHRCSIHGPLARYAKLRVRMRRECRERFPRHRGWAIPTCITARASRTCRDACRDHEQAVSFEIGGGGKRSRHSRRMRNLQFYVSGKRPIRHFNGILCICFPATVVEWVV